MQTFLPYPDFARSARALDVRRLGKQRVECLQVVRGLTVPDYGWRHHPAVRMWRGHLEALGRYTLACCEVWTEGGRADTCAATVVLDLREAGVTRIRTQAELAAALRERGFRTTQATISRDVAELGLVKAGRGGTSAYAIPARLPNLNSFFFFF